jgi:FKBP-type peptidyl-prolyl cis-trans isomerase SlyD
MSQEVVTDGKYVSLTYSIFDERGQVLEQNDLPVGYIHGGRNELLGGLDRKITGRRAGETVELDLAAGEAFGPHDPDLTFTDVLDNVPPQFRYVGAEVPMQSENGEVRTFYVTRIANGRLTVDGNHPFAGRALRVHVRIQEVRDPSREELAQDGAAQTSHSLH